MEWRRVGETEIGRRLDAHIACLLPARLAAQFVLLRFFVAEDAGLELAGARVGAEGDPAVARGAAGEEGDGEFAALGFAAAASPARLRSGRLRRSRRRGWWRRRGRRTPRRVARARRASTRCRAAPRPCARRRRRGSRARPRRARGRRRRRSIRASSSRPSSSGSTRALSFCSSRRQPVILHPAPCSNSLPAEAPNVAATPSTTVCARHVNSPAPSKRPKKPRISADAASATA